MTETAEATNLAKVGVRNERRRELPNNAFSQLASNLIGEKGINGSILNLFGGEQAIVPETPGDPLRLLNLHAQNMEAQRLQPSLPQVRVTPKLIRCQRTKVTHIGHVEVIVLKKLVGVSAYSNAEESNIRISEEGNERVGNVMRVNNLEDEAGVTHAELEGGYGVLRVGPSVGPPLNVQAHHEAPATVGVSGEPRGDMGGMGGDEGVDGVGLESDVV